MAFLSQLCFKAIAFLNLRKNLFAINKSSSAILKALKPFFDDSVHLFVGVGTRHFCLLFGCIG